MTEDEIVKALLDLEHFEGRTAYLYRDSGKDTAGNLVGNAKSVHAERSPCFPCSCWSKIGATMFVRSTNNRRSYFIGVPGP